MKKLSVTDLLKNKEQYQIKDDVTEELYIERLDSSITIRKPERSLCIEAFEMANDKSKAGESDVFMVYNVIVEPDLKDSKLQKEFGCVEPTDIVSKLFEPGEITNIAKYGLELAGYSNSVDRVKSIKN